MGFTSYVHFSIADKNILRLFITYVKLHAYTACNGAILRQIFSFALRYQIICRGTEFKSTMRKTICSVIFFLKLVVNYCLTKQFIKVIFSKRLLLLPCFWKIMK